MAKELFLSGGQYSGELSRLLKEHQEIDLAVAFLGSRSVELLGGVHSGRLICNLESGATNPAAVRSILEHGRIAVRTLPILHAKVAIGGDTVICGSANLSANGLGQEGIEAAGWLEAGIVTSHRRTVASARQWFGELWDISQEIEREALEFAESQWALRRGNTQKCLEAADEFRLKEDGPIWEGEIRIEEGSISTLAIPPELMKDEGEVWEVIHRSFRELMPVYRKLRLALHEHMPVLRAEWESGGPGWIKFRDTSVDPSARQYAHFGFVLQRRNKRIEVWFRRNQWAPSPEDAQRKGLAERLDRKSGKAFFIQNKNEIDDDVVRWICQAR